MNIILILLSVQTTRASFDFLDNMICSTCRDVADNVEQFIEPMRDDAVEDIVEIVEQVQYYWKILSKSTQVRKKRREQAGAELCQAQTSLS